jgi:hypothetical protein
MKRIVTVIIALAMLALAFPIVPALADSNVTTTVKINQSGTPPSILVKWEQDDTGYLENGDTGHGTLMSQFLPPGSWGGLKSIQYFAVPDDLSGLSAIQEVHSYVYSPEDSPYPYYPNPDTPLGMDPHFKYKVDYSDLEVEGYEGEYYSTLDPSEARDLFDAAVNAGLVQLGPGVEASVVSEGLLEETYHLWYGTADLTYEQPAGDYQVDVYAVNKSNQSSPELSNTFTYIGMPGLEVDFNNIDYGSVSLGARKQVPGNTNWDSPAGTNNATIRNIGNVWSHPVISQDDMGFGKANGDAWNVQFGARVDTNQNVQMFYPQQRQTVSGLVSTGIDPVMLDDYIELSTVEKLDFYIQVNNVIPNKTTYTGTMTISWEIEPFEVD